MRDALAEYDALCTVAGIARAPVHPTATAQARRPHASNGAPYVGFYADVVQRDQLKARARARGCSVSDILRELVAAYLARA